MTPGQKDNSSGLLAAAKQLHAIGRTDSAFQILARADSEHSRNMAAFLAAPDGVSVIVPTYRGAEHIMGTLESLAEQTLSRAFFEVIVVPNGPDDGTLALLKAFRLERRKLDLRVIPADETGAGNARNIGLRHAKRKFTTFIDDDDTVSRDYLEALYRVADYDTISVARLVDSCNGQNTPSVVTAAVNARIASIGHGGTMGAEKIGGLAFVTVAKLFPTFVREHVQFQTDLSSGEDVVFWTEVFSRFAFKMRLHRAKYDALYLRAVRPGSVSRQQPTFQFSVIDRLRCVEKIIAKGSKEQSGKLVETAVSGQLSFTQHYLLENPRDWEMFVSEASALDAGYDIIGHVAKQAARTLVISYCFPPYGDPAGNVMAKRVRIGGELVDVISNRMSKTRAIDPTLTDIYHGYVGNHDILECQESYSSSAATMEFAEAAAARVVDTGRIERYHTLYSRAMWAPSHYAAALIKLRHPHLKWIAEYSDPLALDIEGNFRDFRISIAWLEASGLLAAVRERLPAIDPKDLLFCWAEILPYALADEIVFTNENQRDYMLEHPWIRQAAAQILPRSRIARQPTLPSGFYEGAGHYFVSPHCINIGYFGRFYKTRGLTEVLQATASLDDELRRQILIYIHCPVPTEITALAAEFGVSRNVVPRPLLAYRDFLGSLRHFDYLLVNDAQTLGLKSRNPYLPSKVSDYLGAGRPIWALSEPGSMLDRVPLPEGSSRNRLGDVEEYRRTLESFISRKKQGGGSR